MSDKPNITALIDAAYERKPGREARPMLSASMIGDECLAYMTLSIKGYPETQPGPQLLRIFAMGHKIEDIVVKDLKAAGLHIMDRDPWTGQQFSYRDWGDHFRSRADGIVEYEEDGEPRTALLEIKSMNDSRWTKCQDLGVKYTERHYYAQVQMMMGLGGFKETLFVAYNKNTSRYFHEYIPFDEFAYYNLRHRVERVMAGERQRISNTDADWRCRDCFKRDACWSGELPKTRDMITCHHSLPNPTGGWTCDKGCTTTCLDWTPLHLTPRP